MGKLLKCYRENNRNTFLQAESDWIVLTQVRGRYLFNLAGYCLYEGNQWGYDKANRNF